MRIRGIGSPLLGTWVLGLALGAAVPAPARAQDQSADAGALDRAWGMFLLADPVAQQDVLTRALAKVEADPEPELKSLLKLRDRARRELARGPRLEPRFFDTAQYAPPQTARAFQPDDSVYAQQQLGLMQPWNALPGFVERWRYDFGANLARPTGFEPTPADAMMDLFAGYVPDNDILVAWIEQKLDFASNLDKLADHFDHAYCDRNGAAFRGITLFDAYASGAVLEMPDADVIAYARHVLGDKSFTSPIPADAKRQSLYDATKDGFLRYYQHRTWIEAAARLYVNPEAALREEHEGLRFRVLFLCLLTRGDVDRMRDELARAKTRDGFIDALDARITRERKRYDDELPAFVARRNKARWAVNLAAQAALKECGYFRE